MECAIDPSPCRPDIASHEIDDGYSEIALVEATCGGRLTIDLGAIVRNYQALTAQAPGARVAAVVKADAYGLGAGRVAPVLAAVGCDTFFVAQVQEGIDLRRDLPMARIFVLNGAAPGAEAACLAHRLEPVLNGWDALEAWSRAARIAGFRGPCAVQFDTGMARFGFARSDAERLSARIAQSDMTVGLVMSHLACADTPGDPANPAQRDAIMALRPIFPRAAFSLAASSGIFLGSSYHLDLVRPGAALYGVSPVPGNANPMAPVVRLESRVVQVRTVPGGTGIGYGHAARAPGPMRLATLAVGYADGFPRSLSGRGSAWLHGLRLPVVGRVSMDSIVVDVSRAPDGTVAYGDFLDLIGPANGVDGVGKEAGTIGYEVLTSLGRRYARRYLG
ncbi:alanine racemase [Methylobacterium sp. E-046]|uniref:alanine racemase n=1 Tax=Methylobacterium sp. E-046 TaxID=2836576 RepID=UPI001FBBA530|nr:alanine racemase [Methylobacterium sp. E-046]MCJ2103063.1 alanine racemase [Methylobacterium sp. E-046]